MSLLQQTPPIAVADDFGPQPERPPTWRWDRRRIAGGLLLLWLLTGIYIVPADEQAVVTRFGRVVEPRALPGIHLSLPWPIDQVTKLKVQQLQRLTIGGGPSDAVLGRTQLLASQFITGDQNILNLRVAVQYSVGAPVDYLFRAQEAARMVASAVESELARRVARRGVDEVLTTGKVAIQEEVRGAAQEIVNRYSLGVLLASVSIESAQPPPEAADAFRDVASARADAARIVSEAQGHSNDVVPKARGEARQMIEASAGYKQRKIDEAGGDASRFTQVAVEYARAPEVNGRRLYAETMEQILPRIRKLIVDSRGNLDLTILRKGDVPAVAK